MTVNRVLDKLSKLRASRDGEAAIGNQAAADAFAEAINRLLLQHELSEVDIPLGGVVQEEPIVELPVDLAAHGIASSRTRVGWQEALAGVVARAHLCKLLVYSGSNRITLVGTKAHVTVAEYAYGVLAKAAHDMSMEARVEWWKRECGGQHLASGGFRASWLSGFIARINERFKEALKREVAAAPRSSTALMRLDKALVRAKQYVDERYKSKVRSASTGGSSTAGYAEGRAAADRVQLRKGVEQRGTQRRIE